MRVLLVEDDEMIGHSLREALQGQGWSVDWVKDGLLAQSAWEDGDYACVLLDLGLPKRDGVEVLRRPQRVTQVAGPRHDKLVAAISLAHQALGFS